VCVDFLLLGPLGVESGGVDLTPARPKQRALLAALLLREGETVSVDELVDVLWGERAPATAHTALQGHVSALRKRLGAERIMTQAPGYRFRLDPRDRFDVNGFETLVGRAGSEPPALRAETLGAALALFRGRPLADFRYESFAAAEAARLEEARLVAVEDRVDALLELGGHAELIPELEALVAEHPHRERLHGQRMLALYRAGRQADALESFRRARHVLATELGIEPGPALRALERRILNHDPQLAAPVSLGRPSQPSERPVGLVTFLHVRSLPNQAAARAAATQCGGYDATEDESEGLLFAFARTWDAVNAALATERVSGGDARCGIHAEDAAARPRGYTGSGPRGAAAVSAAAHAGRVLVSESAADLLRQAPPADSGLREVGRFRLQDLGPTWTLFELLPEGADASLSPPRGLDSHLTNLPPQPGPLVGRDRELRELRRAVLEADSPLVTVTGAAGIGKTRLALHAAATLLDEFPDGVFLVELAPLADAELVVPTAARRVGAGDSTEHLAHALRDRRMLVVVDNCEHVAKAAASLADLAGGAPRSRLLATSRVPLRVPRETLYRLEPLELPAAHASLEDLALVDSVALFATRARAVRTEFAVGEENAEAVAGICRALDGLPLAIELAATRAAVLAPAALLRRLDERLALLSAGRRGAVDRHRTLRAAIDWSYALLEPPERRLLARLGIFAGGFTLEAAEEVCGSGLDAIGGLAALVDASLVRVEGTEAEPRFRLLETTREYAHGRLAELAEAHEVARRHAAFFVALAEETEPYLREDPGRRLELLERDHDNLRAALDALEAAGEHGLHLRLAGALWRFWYLHGHLGEGRRRIERALGLERGGDAFRVRALIGAAVLSGNQDDRPAQVRWAREALDVSRRLGDAWSEAYATHMLGTAAGATGSPAEAQSLYEESILGFRRLGDEHSALLVARNLAILLETTGEPERSRALHEQNLRTARETGNPRIEASTLGTLALAAADEGRLEDALAMARRSLEIHRGLGDVLDTGLDICRSASVLARDGRAEAAAELLFAFEKIRGQMGGRSDLVAELNARTLAAVAEALGAARLVAARARARQRSLDESLAVAIDATPERWPA
jgi:predicted ATPase/DNA-binding SARP family transcriptional activator